MVQKLCKPRVVINLNRPTGNSSDRLGSQLPARNDSIIVNETWTSAGGSEREPESRGGAAVPPDGAEADVATLNRADATGDDRTDFSIHRVALPPPVRINPREERVQPGALEKATEPGKEDGLQRCRQTPYWAEASF